MCSIFLGYKLIILVVIIVLLAPKLKRNPGDHSCFGSRLWDRIVVQSNFAETPAYNEQCMAISREHNKVSGRLLFCPWSVY